MDDFGNDIVEVLAASANRIEAVNNWVRFAIEGQIDGMMPDAELRRFGLIA